MITKKALSESINHIKRGSKLIAVKKIYNSSKLGLKDSKTLIDLLSNS